jgi:hypothetical protein
MEQGVSALFVRQQHINAEDGLDTCTHRGFVKLDQPEEIIEVSNGNRGHSNLFDRFHQRLDADGAVDQGIFGVEAEVDEWGHGVLA